MSNCGGNDLRNNNNKTLNILFNQCIDDGRVVFKYKQSHEGIYLAQNWSYIHIPEKVPDKEAFFTCIRGTSQTVDLWMG